MMAVADLFHASFWVMRQVDEGFTHKCSMLIIHKIHIVLTVALDTSSC